MKTQITRKAIALLTIALMVASISLTGCGDQEPIELTTAAMDQVLDEMAGDEPVCEGADPETALELLEFDAGPESSAAAAGRNCYKEYNDRRARCYAQHRACMDIPIQRRPPCGIILSECLRMASNAYWGCLFRRTFRWCYSPWRRLY